MIPKTITRILLLFLFFFFIQIKALAQFAPYFENYDLSQYNAGNQNWGISKADDGRLYVANNKGLLEFDGLNWELHPLPNKTTLRSVLAINDKIYVGSYEEFGFWERNKYGHLDYTSLSKDLASKEFSNEEFWQIIPFRDAIVFRSFQHLYIYTNGTIEKVIPKSTVMFCSVLDNQLYVATLKDGIFVLDKNGLQPVVTAKALDDVKIVSLTTSENQLLIATALEGIYTYTKDQLRPWHSEINNILKEQQLNTFSTMADGQLVWGTIKNGVYITNKDGQVLFHMHKENGLINNTILSQYIDQDRQLWLGLDNGIAVADLKSAYLFYNDISGNLGAVYDVIKYQNTIYIGSNTGLYYIDASNNLQFIDGSQGQVWNLKEIEGDLLCGHNNGTYLVKDKKLELISSYTGGWVMEKVIGASKTYIQGTYAGLVRFKKEHHKWTVKHLGQTTIPSRFLTFEDPYTAWVAHAYKGLYKIKFDASYDHILEVKSYENKGLSSPFNVRVYTLKNDICVRTNAGWQKYEPLLDTLVPYPLLNKSFGKNAYIISENDIQSIAVRDKNSIKFKSFPDDGTSTYLSGKYFKKRLIIGYENISKLTDSVYALSLNNGFMLFDEIETSNAIVLQRPQLVHLEIDKTSIDLTSLGDLKLENDFKSLSMTFSAPLSKDYFFEYAITHKNSFKWYKLESKNVEFSNVNYGNYQFQIRTSNTLGNTSEPFKMQLTIAPPWYNSASGYILYIVLIIITGYLFYVLHRRKISRQKRLLQEKFEKEQQELLKEQNIENEKRVVEVKNQSLQNEVKLKSKQLANTAMALVKKNETLLELKNEIASHKTTFGNVFSYKKIMKKIDNSISHKDEWKIFEFNFNQVHEEYFKLLKQKHPHLTAKDLRICAYIKMDLSTKEIAPLLNISIRGVETQRYRLKTKLQLDTDQSLTEYLQNIN